MTPVIAAEVAQLVNIQVGEFKSAIKLLSLTFITFLISNAPRNVVPRIKI